MIDFLGRSLEIILLAKNLKNIFISLSSPTLSRREMPRPCKQRYREDRVSCAIFGCRAYQQSSTRYSAERQQSPLPLQV